MVVNILTAGLKIIGTTTTGKQKQEEKGDNKYAICTIVNSDICFQKWYQETQYLKHILNNIQCGRRQVAPHPLKYIYN